MVRSPRELDRDLLLLRQTPLGSLTWRPQRGDFLTRGTCTSIDGVIGVRLGTEGLDGGNFLVVARREAPVGDEPRDGLGVEGIP